MESVGREKVEGERRELIEIDGRMEKSEGREGK